MRNHVALFVIPAILGLGASAAEKPVVTWAAYPVGAGDHVVVHGGGWGEGVRIEADGKSLQTTTLSDTGLVFPFPAAEEKIVEGRVVNAAGASESFALNEPTVWWMQGDGGDSSTPGGTLRVFGRSLAPYYSAGAGGVPRVWLGGRELVLEKKDVWSLDARVPVDMKPGRHPVQISNGLKGGRGRYEAGTWEVAAAHAVWKSDIFNVLDYGAEENDLGSDSDAFAAAMDAAAKNGGGTVYVPAGRFMLTKTLVIPPHVLLKGEDRALSQIVWPDTQEPPENLIEGSHSFGIHDLFISSGLYRNGIVAKNDMAGANCMASSRGTTTHDVSLKRLRVKLVSDQWRDERNLQNFLPRYSLRGDGIIVRNCLRGEIEDCVIYCDKDAQRTLFFNFTGDYIRMANCRISGSGWAIFGGDRCIYENNDANNCTYSISSVCRRMFWSGNRQTDLFTNNREAVTHDGARTAWCAKKRGEQGCASGTVEGTRVKLTFPGNLQWKTGTNFSEWVGCELQITDGAGAGQTREIVSMKSYADLEIDRPFDLVPDASSLFVIVAERKHLIYVDNDTEDAGVAIQLYGGVTDCVVARNRCRRAGGFHGSGRDYHGVITCWYVQFLGNVVEEGNCHRGSIGTDFRGAGASLIGAFPPNVKWPFSQTYVYRDNEIRSNGSLFISVKNALVEKNTVRRSEVGVTSRRYQETMYVADNVFDRVVMPYLNLKGAHISPQYVDRSREEFLGRLKAITAGTDKVPLRSRDEKRAFGFTFKVNPWNANFRAVAGGRSHKPFKLPVTLAVEGVLAEDIRAAAIRIPAAGGWDFGGEVVLKKDQYGFSADVPVTPPKEGEVGMFTWPVSVSVMGEGWTYQTEMRVNPLSQNRFLQLETGIAEKGNAPKVWRKVKFMGEGMDGHESVFPEKLWGKELEGKEFHLRTRIRVNRTTRFAFTRGDWATYLLVDGKVVIRPETGTTTAAEVTLEPDDHVLELLRPAKGEYPSRGGYEGVFLHCEFPEGCTAGDWVQLQI
ncbi:MAG: glycosyl hydrolase family 28-related protein [bacterium]|nr:glycosyl hydrolase family 28-related protein [bacterium]